MARLTLLLLWLVFGATASWAQGVPVRSGDHDRFARLVFPARAGLSWDVTRDTPRAAIIRFDDPTLRLDLGDVFARIPRNRIQTLTSGSEGLALTLACDCEISVRQIPSNHIVIDILDPVPGAGSLVPEPTREVAQLPLRLAPVDTLSTGLRLTPRLPIREGQPPLGTNAPPPATETAPQVVIREHARSGFVRSPTGAEGSSVTRAPACTLETLAARLLLEDPVAAVASLPDRRAAIIDGSDRLSDQNLRALAETYLAAGWGAEAIAVLTRASTDAEELRLIGRALDSDPNLASEGIAAEAGCGPATATLLLISGVFDASWDSVDEDALIRLVDRMTDDRRADVQPRLRDSLARLGHEDILLRLAQLPQTEPAYRTPSTEVQAAGTGTGAVRAAMDLLRDNSAAPESVGLALQNALALRQSIPAGPLRGEYDTLLTDRLVRAGYLPEAARLVGEHPPLAAQVMEVALTHLPPEQVIELGLRLRPHLPSDAVEVTRVANLMEGYGLTALARDFSAVRTGEGPVDQRALWRQPALVAEPGPPGITDGDRAWLQRDFAAVLSDDTRKAEDPRRRLAATVQARNLAPAPTDDFDRARAAADRARNLSATVQDLLAAEDDAS